MSDKHVNFLNLDSHWLKMALQAQKDFHEIDFKKSVMVGDGLHDMEFGRRLGMQRVYISEKPEPNSDLYDFQFVSLSAFLNSVEC